MFLKEVLLTLFLVACAAMAPLPSWPKTWTVDQRQSQQMKDINAGQKSGQLTVKQSEKLRRDLAQVARKKKKMRAKENGKLTAADTSKLHESFDKVSGDISRTKRGQVR